MTTTRQSCKTTAAMAQQAGMHNTEGINVDLYIPRKWCVAPSTQRKCAARAVVGGRDTPFFIRLLLCSAPGHITHSPLCLRSSATNRLIEAKDKASVQINVGHVNGAPAPSNQQSTQALPTRLARTTAVAMPAVRSRWCVHWRVDNDGAVRVHPRHGRGRWLLRPAVDKGVRGREGEWHGDLAAG